MSLPKSLPGLVLVLVCLASAISPAQAQTGPDQPRLLAPTGPHAVGRSAFHWLDEDRAELHTPDDPDDRPAAGRAPAHDPPAASSAMSERCCIPGHEIRDTAS